MSRADLQIAELLLRDGDGKTQDFFSNLEKTADGKLSFIVGRGDTGEYYRHTIETVFLSETDLHPEAIFTADPNEINFYKICGHSATVAEIQNRPRCADCQKSVDERFNEFWREIIFPDGKLDIEEVKGNLLDFSFVMDNAKQVYMHITGGNIGDLMTYGEAVIGEADRQVQKQIDAAVEEALEECSDISAGTPGLQIVIDKPDA